MELPKARKIPTSLRWGHLRNRRGIGALTGPGFPSGHAEYAIEGEANRFRYVSYDNGWTVAGGPGQGRNDERRVIAVVGFQQGNGGSPALFEELADRPLNPPEDLAQFFG